MKTEEEYNAEVLKLMRDLYPTLKGEERERAERLFPELKESWDEKVRKWLIEMVEEVRKANPTNAEHNGMCSEAIAWIEKQGEKNPAWSEEDRDYYDAIIAKLELTRYDALLTDNQMAFLKSLKERYTWKPTDAQIASLTIACDRNDRIGFDLTQLLRDLKKLKEE